MSTRTSVRPSSIRHRSSRPAAVAARPDVASRRAAASTPLVHERGGIDWFTVGLYVLMVAGILGFSFLAYMLFVPAS